MLRISIDNAAGGSVRAKCSSKFRILKVGKSERNEELPDLAFLLAIITFVAGERGVEREIEIESGKIPLRVASKFEFPLMF